MGLEIFHVDAFTDRPFAGNPAAVCVLAESRDELRDENWDERLVQAACPIRPAQRL